MIPDVKRSLVINGDGITHHQGMLDEKMRLAEKLKKLIGSDPGQIAASVVAEKCDVTVQAVYDWRNTGKITFTNLAIVANLTGKPLSFFSDEIASPTEQYTIERTHLMEDYDSLPEALKEHLARKARELRAYVEALPSYLRDGLKQPPKEWDAYKQFERELETDMEKRIRASGSHADHDRGTDK